MRRRRTTLLSAALAALCCPLLPDAAAGDSSAPTASALTADAPAGASTAASAPAADTPAASGTTPPKPAPRPLTQADFDALYEFGSQLFEDYAPDQIKEHYQFLTRDEWHAFTAGLQRSLSSGSFEELAALEPAASRTLAGLRLMPEFSDYADWLAERLDLIESARQALNRPPPRPPPPPLLARPPAPQTPPPTAKPPTPFTPPAPPAPAPPPPSLADGGWRLPRLPFTTKPPPLSPVPYYDIWLERLRDRPAPPGSAQLIPLLKVIFNAEKIPAEFVWLAEVESSFNPDARSPVGARGLFQLMPATAKAFGLRTWPFDERAQPGKSARAAAQLLRRLHSRFDSWPLTLAAYNAGEGRVAAALKKTPGATSFADIAEKLPAETRLYVPKVLATITVREKIPLSRFAPTVLPASPNIVYPPPLVSFSP